MILNLLTTGFGRLLRHGRLGPSTLAALALAVPGAAQAATGTTAATGPPAGAPTPTAAERAAIRFQSVSATDDPALGLIVDMTFTGNVQQELGQNGLANAVLAMLVESDAPYAPIDGVLNTGGGAATAELPTVHHRRVVVTVKVKNKTRKRTKAVTTVTWHGTPFQEADQQVAVGPDTAGAVTIRDGASIIVWLPSVAVPQGTPIALKVLARGIPGVPFTPGKPPSLSSADWTAAVAAPATTSFTAKVTAGNVPATTLSALSHQLTATAAALTTQITSGRRAQSEIAAGLNTFTRNQRVVAPAARTEGVSQRLLRQDLTALAAGRTGLNTAIGNLGRLAPRVSTLETATATPAVTVVQSDSRLSQSMAAQAGVPQSPLVPSGIPVIGIDPAIQYQHFEGLGAAMTDSVAALIENDLPPASQVSLMQALFGPPDEPNGLGLPDIDLQFLRVGIGASGAMTYGAPYSYDDLQPGATDQSLSLFSLSPDQSTVIPALQQALAANPKLTVLATPWSPPGWMKSNDALDDATGTDTLLPADFGTYAKYIVQFLQGYAAAGIPINALTVQNEPSSGNNATPYPGLDLSPTDEANFITSDLEPALQAAGLSPQIYGSDLSWDSSAYGSALLQTPAAGDLAGLAWHCYFGSPAIMSTFAAAAPSLQEIVDECSPEIRGFGTPEAIISSLRNWASVFSLWTLGLDPLGGPIQPGNHCGGCTGPVTIDETTQTASVRPEYYQLGQVSAYVQPGAVRLASNTFVTYSVSGAVETVSAGLDDVAFENPNGSTVLVAYNNSAAPITFAVSDGGQYFLYTIPSHAMTTFTWGG